MKIFAVLDVKSQTFDSLHVTKSTADALRGFDAAVNDAEKRSSISQFPDDFAICELGSFDQQTGKLNAYEMPLNLATGRSLVRQMNLPSVQ